MNKLFAKLIVVGLMSFFTLGCATSTTSAVKPQVTMSYNQLKLMDLDQMTDMMQQKSQEYKRTDNVKALQEGLQICFSRPNEDGLIEKIISIIKTPMEDHDLWESSIVELVDRGIASFGNENTSGADQVTYGFVLENIVSEFKPLFVKQYESPGFETQIIEKIANADVEFSKQAAAERKLGIMRGHISPSVFAKKLIERKEEVLKERNKSK
ncbi:MAG: hypothetical protein WA160_14015 [Pseudobdellovibrio sp.]